jgi:hypothetical protein
MGGMTSELSGLVVPALGIFALAVSITGIVLGLALALRAEATLRWLGAMNQWVSSRRAMKPLEIPRDADPHAAGGRRWVGVVVALVGAYALFVLSLQLDTNKLASALGQHSRYSLAAIAIDGLRWVLVAGCAVAAIAGVMMVVAPRALHALEVLGNRWISTRQLAAGGDQMHMGLDRLAGRYPRAAGVAIAALSIAATAASVVLLLARR